MAGNGEPRFWTFVLAAGEGRRMRPSVRTLLGQERPKQYCTFVGTRSMLEHTLDRAKRIGGPERIVTVIGKGHRPHLAQALHDAPPGRVVEQPRDCGTCAGVFLPAAYVMEQDPQATVLILPADHFVRPEERFVQTVFRACRLAEASARMVLVGAKPGSSESDYGWIVPYGETQSAGYAAVPHAVVGLREKPDPAAAAELFRTGALWSTMIVAVRLETLWCLGWQHVPALTERFDNFRRVLHAVQAGRVGQEHEALALDALYQGLEPADFSRDLLAPAVDSCWVLGLDGVEWSDWGRPERVWETLARHAPRKPPSLRPAHGPDAS